MFDWLKKKHRGNDLLAICPGHSGVSAALVRRAGDAPPVLAWAEFLATADHGAAFGELRQRRNLENLRCTSLVDIGDYSLILTETPAVPAAELRDAVRWRVKDMIDFSVEDAVIDVFNVPTLKGGQDNMLYAVVVPRQAVRQRAMQLSDAGFALECVDIPEFAIRNLTSLMPEDVGGVTFVHLEENAGLITITRQNTLYLSRRFDYGRSRLAAAGVTEVTPEIEGSLDGIVIEIQRSLDYYESHFAQPPVHGVVMSPLGHDIKGLADYLGSQLGIPTRIMALDALIEMEDPLSPGSEGQCLAAIGAALRYGEAAS